MNGFLLTLVFSMSAQADAPVPYYPRSFDSNQSLGGINENLLDITGRNRDNLVPIVGDNSCPPGQALTGATQKNGYIFGGTCQGIVASSTSPINYSSLFSLSGSTTDTTFGTCWVGSTVTITTLGGHIEVWFTGSFEKTIANQSVFTNFLQDGLYVSPMSASSPASADIPAAANAGVSGASFKYFLTVATGTHSYCLQTRVSAGTAKFSADSANQFGVADMLGGAVGPTGATGPTGGPSIIVTNSPYNAVCNGVADDSTAIQNALDASHGSVGLGCNHQCKILSGITIHNSGVIFDGCGSAGNDLNGSSLLKASTLNGSAITIATGNVVINNLRINGAAGNGGPGISLQGNHNVLNNVGIYTMGGDGVRVGCDVPTCNVNSWLMSNVDSTSNGGRGFYISDKPWGTPPDASAGTCINCRALANGDDGLYVRNANFNTFVNFLPENNAGYGVHVTSNAVFTNFYGGDADELNTLGSVLIDTGTRNVVINGMTFGSTLYNYGVSPILTTIESAASVTGGNGLVVGATWTAFGFEVTDPTSTQGQVTVDNSNGIVMFGRLSAVPGSSTRVRMQGRLGNRVMEWNTTGGSASFWNPSGDAGLFGIGTSDPHTALDVEGNAQIGFGVSKSTFTGSGSLNLAFGITGSTGAFTSTVTVSGPLGVGTLTPQAFMHISSKPTNGPSISLKIDGDATTPLAIASSFTFTSAGYLGIGTASPLGPIDISSGTRSGTTCKTCPVYVTAAFGQASVPGVEFRYLNNTAGLGFGYSGLYTTGTNQFMYLVPNGTGGLGVGFEGSGANKLDVYGNAAIGTTAYGVTAPTNGLAVVGNLSLGRANNQAPDGISISSRGYSCDGAGCYIKLKANGLSDTAGNVGTIVIKHATDPNTDLLSLRQDNSFGYLHLDTKTGAVWSNIMTIDPANTRIGIGAITQPNAGLDVRSSTVSTGYVLAVSSQNSGVIFGVTGSGVIVSSSAIPTATCDAGTPVVSATATNQHGQLVAGTSSTNCTVTFSAAMPKTPDCICQDRSSLVSVRVSAESTASFTCAAVTLSGDTITWWCPVAP